MELVIFPIIFAFVLLFAAVVRVLGVDLGYKVLFVGLAFIIVLKTMFGW